MSDISAALHEEIVLRAGNRCEYCGLSQLGQEAAFHVDHVVPRSAGGPTAASNLALACVSCSLRKWAKQTAADPDSGREVDLFNPRTQIWNEHFRWEGERVVGLTPTGRATVGSLAMNRLLILAIRQEETARGRHPPTRSGAFRLSKTRQDQTPLDGLRIENLYRLLVRTRPPANGDCGPGRTRPIRQTRSRTVRG